MIEGKSTQGHDLGIIPSVTKEPCHLGGSILLDSPPISWCACNKIKVPTPTQLGLLTHPSSLETP